MRKRAYPVFNTGIGLFRFASLTTSLFVLLSSLMICGNALASGSWDELAGSATDGGVSNNSGSYAPSLALDNNGNPHIAWKDYSGGNVEIYYAYWDGDSWETYGGANTGGGLSNNAGESGDPSLALDTNGNPHIAWHDTSSGNYEIYYAYWDGDSWETYGGGNTGGGVSNNAASHSWYPSLALDSSGRPHIAWEDGFGVGANKIYYAYWDGANWVTHGNGNTGGGVSNNAGWSGLPSLALDTNGNPHIAWTDSSSGNSEIYYAYWSGSGWATRGGGNTGSGVSNVWLSSMPSLALDSSGNPHIAWHCAPYPYPSGDWEIYYTYWNGTGWVTHGGANTGHGVSAGGWRSFEPSLALDSSGNPHIALYDETSAYLGQSNSEIYYAYWDGTNWVTHGGGNTGGGVSNNTGYSSYPSLALDSSGRPHIAWGDPTGGNGEIYYRYWNPGVSGPVADFSCNSEHGEAPLTVHFTNNSTGDIDTCEWDFGDGTSIVTGCDDPEHTYPDEGTYIVTLTVTGPGGTDTAECTIEVSPSELEKPTGVKHVVFIDIDGLRPDVFKAELNAGNLSTFQYLMGGASYDNPGHAIVVKDTRTGFPSLTLPGHASIFTGCYVNKHGIYGNSWFDRTKGTKGTAYHYLGLLTALFNYNLANSNLQRGTIYDVAATKKYDSIVGFNYYYDYGKKDRQWIKWLQPDAYEKGGLFAPGETNDFDDAMMYRVLEELQKRMYKGGEWDAAKFPKILTLYFAAVDHEGHNDGVDSQKYNLREINSQLQMLIFGGAQTYPAPRAEDGSSKERGIIHSDISFSGLRYIDAVGGGGRKLVDDVVFVICADHGHSNVNENRLICFDDIKEAIENIDSGYDVERILPGNGKKKAQGGRLFSKNPKILLELNDGMAHVYVQNKQSKKWKVPPDLCNDIVPFARILARTQDTLGDYILKREGVSMILVKDKDAGKYKVFNGGNGCTSPLEELTEYFTDDEAFRINMLYNGVYSGDIVILANYDDSGQSEGYYLEDPYWSKVITVCPSPMQATHGNINLSNLKIPFIIAGKNVKSASVPEAEQVDIAPTVADILGFSMPQADGTSIFQK